MAGKRNGEGNMSVRDAGRKGGKTTSNKYGREFYQDIGSKSHKNDSRMKDEDEW
jgi:general stress protein YciG